MIWRVYFVRENRLTCVCVNPKLAASSARSGRAKYCVRWNLRLSCCNWSELYIVLGFRIFLPLPFTRRPVSSILSEILNLLINKSSEHRGKFNHMKVWRHWKSAAPLTLIFDSNLFRSSSMSLWSFHCMVAFFITYKPQLSIQNYMAEARFMCTYESRLHCLCTQVQFSRLANS